MRSDGPNDIPDSTREPADLTEVVRLHGIRHWIEQSYEQVNDELGWADFQVRSTTAIRRHQTLVNCAWLTPWLPLHHYWAAVLMVVSGSLAMKLASDEQGNPYIGGY